MSAQIYDAELEASVLATVLSPDYKLQTRQRMYVRLSGDMFGSKAARAVHACIEDKRRSTRRLWDAHSLSCDPSTPQAVRDMLAQFTAVPLKSATQFADALDSLAKWASKRAVYETTRRLSQALEAGAYDDEAVAALLREAQRRVMRPAGMSELVLDPRNPALLRQTHAILAAAREHQSKRWPTGWPTLDKIMGGGLGPLDVLLMAANTGGGKSMAALALAMAMAERGANVCYFSFEMSQNSTALRLLARHAGPTRGELAGGKLSSADTKAAAERFALVYSQYAGSMRVLTPDMGFARPTVDYLEGVIQRSKTDVVVVDYMAMLSDPSLRNVNDEVRLRTMTAELKMLAAATQVGVIALAQLNEEANDIKHSRGAKDGADYVLAWNSKNVNNTDDSYLVNILKKREQPGPSPDTFWLTQDYDHLSIYEPAEAPSQKAQTNIVDKSLGKMVNM